MVDALKTGQFGFYKDSELKYKLEDGELFDQMTADGWIDIWFGGKVFWLPDLGEFDILAFCEQSFFWDILDSSGTRNIHGFEQIFVSRNEMVEPHYGDLRPLNPEEVFEVSNPQQVKTSPSDMNNANLWWVNHMFRDQYYRYSIIALPNTAQEMNEIDAQILPINYNIQLPAYHYAYGYRPKFEYFSKLAVMRKIVSGDRGKIHFRFKVDLDYLAQNPDTKRSIRLFTQTDDVVKFLPYQNDPTKIIWKNQRNDYKRMFLNYLLNNAIVMYLPGDGAFEQIERKHDETIELSNLVLQADGATYDLMKRDFQAMYGGYSRIYNGYTLMIMDRFNEWLQYNLKAQYNDTHQDGEVYSDYDTILDYTMFTKKYYKGFSYLADDLGLITIPTPYIGPVTPHIFPTQFKTIVMGKSGAREFSNGVQALRANDYIHSSDPEYLYEGETGNGYYWIRGNNDKPRTVFCDMETDMGGWMLVYTMQNILSEYFYNIYSLNEAAERQFGFDETKGTGFGGNDEALLDAQWMSFNEVELLITMEHNDTMVTLYNTEGLLVRYDASDEAGVIATYRDESTNFFPHGEISDNFSLPTIQNGFTISFNDSTVTGQQQYIKMIKTR